MNQKGNRYLRYVIAVAAAAALHGLPVRAEITGMEMAASAATHGATDWASFAVDGTSYLAVANNATSRTAVYRWDGTALIHWGEFDTDHPVDLELFVRDGETYLAVASRHDGSSNNVISRLYRWDRSGEQFVAYQTFATRGATAWEYFEMNGVSFLAVANYETDGSTVTTSTIYRDSDGDDYFENFQEVPTDGATDWAFFASGGEYHLARSFVSSGYEGGVVVYTWDPAQERFIEGDSYAGGEVRGVTAFSVDGEQYLAVADRYGEGSYSRQSPIYRWNGSALVTVQTVATEGVMAWKSFQWGGDTYLAQISGYDGGDYQGAVDLYRWDGAAFAATATFATGAARGAAFAEVGGVPFLVVASERDEIGENVLSPVLRLTESALPAGRCEGRAAFDVASGELQLPLMDIATVPLLGGVARPQGGAVVPVAATLRMIPGTTLFEVASVVSATPEEAPSVTPCHAAYGTDGALDVPRVNVPVVTTIGGLTVATGMESYHATLELMPMSDLFRLTAIEPLP